MGAKLRYADLVKRGYVNNKTTLRNWINKGIFPPGELIGPNTRAWDEDKDIAPWEAINRPTAPKPTPKSPGRPRKAEAKQAQLTE
jgi:hypothetical protein